MSKKTNFGKINGREAMVVGIIIVMVALFSILSREYPKVCVNLQTDVR